MTPPPSSSLPTEQDADLMRIGAAAELAETSCRTLRYYEELGLLRPAYSVGGTRRYSHEDVRRLLRIRELQELLGFDLGAIGDILRSEDRLAGLRDEFRAGVTPARHRQILAEATTINDRLRSIVRVKQERLTVMMEELEEKATLYRSRAKELSDGGFRRRDAGGSVSTRNGTTPTSPGGRPRRVPSPRRRA